MVVAGFAVVGVVGAALDDELDAGDELDDCEADDCGEIDESDEDVSVVVPVVLPVLDGLVVLDAARSVSSLPPRSPGCATASARPATRTPTAAINKRDARCFRVETSSGERVTGVEPASPAWKAGALPLSYTRVHGWNVVGRT